MLLLASQTSKIPKFLRPRVNCVTSNQKTVVNKNVNMTIKIIRLIVDKIVIAGV